MPAARATATAAGWGRLPRTIAHFFARSGVPYDYLRGRKIQDRLIVSGVEQLPGLLNGG